MAVRTADSFAQPLRTLFRVGVVGGLSDGQLLDRFATGHREDAEAAFRALMDRHGPMVLRAVGWCSTTRMMPKTPSRRRSSSWPVRLARFVIAARLRAGYTGLPGGSPRTRGPRRHDVARSNDRAPGQRLNRVSIRNAISST